MLNKALGTFVDILKRYYPPEELIVENGTIAVSGYLARLLRHLLKRGYARKFAFITYIIEYVDYTEAMDKAEQLIDELNDVGVIFKDVIEKDLYRVSKIGFDVLQRIEIRRGIS